jgi:transposase-like protein
MGLNYHSLDYPIDIRRRIDRKWQRRLAAAPARAASAKHDGEAACPRCQAPAPIASVYRGAGLIHHQWRCTACGQAWTTAVRIPE